MSESTHPTPPDQSYRHPEPAADPFGMPLDFADVAAEWPPSDPAELARLDEWMTAREREEMERNPWGDGGE